MNIQEENCLADEALEELEMCCQTLCNKRPIYDYIAYLTQKNIKLMKIIEKKGLQSMLDDV